MPYSESPEITSLINGIRIGNRASLAKAITLVESDSEKHIAKAAELLERCLPYTGKSIRIGITGSPGAGKSTFINAFGKHLIDKHNKRVAVLAVDPSSRLSGGSILGDKTRMPELAVDEDAFIRPSPSRGDLGGVAARTRESVLLCEAAGYDVILVETVGVGQSETAVHEMVDFFLLILLPGSGDDLQGIKKGIMEMTDLVVVNKADGDMLKKAGESQSFYRQALMLMHSRRSNWSTPVLLASSTENSGMEEIWKTITEFVSVQKESSAWDENRSLQNITWFDRHLEEAVGRYVKRSEKVRLLREALLPELRTGKIHPLNAAEDVMKRVLGEWEKEQ
ncbi:MAG: methylmalonyl Co-A mutase-associated GTPase MeaB [Bacteroidetes bacterium]|nr:methylmalonyl Co-A mutase-associated GTPase MeaB [Bacteroidota bacterium]